MEEKDLFSYKEKKLNCLFKLNLLFQVEEEVKKEKLMMNSAGN
jgi:hypothetical protein